MLLRVALCLAVLCVSACSRPANPTLTDAELFQNYAGQFSGVVPIDHDRALAAKLVAAKEGYFRAQYDVGFYYASIKDFKEAAKWWTTAAEQGDLGSLANLSQVYREGLGVPRNPQKALELLLLARRMAPREQMAALQPEIDALRNEIYTEGIDQAEKAAASWVPRPTALSNRAISGIEEAQKLVQ